MMTEARGKRTFDLVLAGSGLLLCLPLLAAIALLIRFVDHGPIFFRQTRLGRHGVPFTILKFRSMRASTTGPGITASGDVRITSLGRFLRRTKLDELPQLWNVVQGSMSLVGPRPEIPAMLAAYPPDLRPVLDLPAGVTDLASLYFRGEEHLLAAVPNPEAYYREICLPAKLRMSLVYGLNRSLRDDIKIICRTLCPGLKWPTLAEQTHPAVYQLPATPSGC